MTCSCAFSGWLKEWLLSFGTAAPFMALGLILLFWGTRKVRREHFGRVNWKLALLINLPSFLLLALGTVVILSTVIVSLT